MPKHKNRLSDMDYDEISTVDKMANADAMFVIAKRAPEEDAMPEFDIYSEAGDLLKEDDLNDGDVVYDAEGNAYQYEEAEEEPAKDEEKELAEVGKSAFLDDKKNDSDFAASVAEELSKAFSQDDRDAVISKALGRVQEIEKKYADLEKVAKSERDLRLTREYVAKAAEYNVPVNADELGPVLYRMAESMSYEDCSVIAKCLETAGEMLFQEVGYSGSGDNADPMSVIESLNGQVAKSAGSDKAPTLEELLDSTPAAYDEYLSAQRARY